MNHLKWRVEKINRQRGLKPTQVWTVGTYEDATNLAKILYARDQAHLTNNRYTYKVKPEGA